MTLGILKESDGEHRVSITPDSISALTKLGFDKILVEQGAGSTAFFDDASYEAQGAQIADTDAVLKNANDCLPGAAALRGNGRQAQPRQLLEAARGSRGSRSSRGRQGL